MKGLLCRFSFVSFGGVGGGVNRRDRPSWRSLQIVSVPTAWGLKRAFSMCGVYPLIPLNGEAAHTDNTGLEGPSRMMVPGDVATYSMTELWRHLSRSPGLAFICLIPKAIRQFSRETAPEIYICLVSTYQLSSVCAPPRVNSIFKSSVSVSV